MSRKYVGFFGGPVGVTFFEGPASCMMAETLISFGMSQVLEWPVLGLTKRSIPWDEIHILNYIERPKSAGIGYFFEKSIASNLKIIQPHLKTFLMPKPKYHQVQKNCDIIKQKILTNAEIDAISQG